MQIDAGKLLPVWSDNSNTVALRYFRIATGYEKMRNFSRTVSTRRSASPSPLNGERAGVRGENGTARSSISEAHAEPPLHVGRAFRARAHLGRRLLAWAACSESAPYLR